MLFSIPLLILCLLFSNATLAEDIRYVSGDQDVPLRAGAGDDYQIVHRGISPRARLIVSRTSEDGLWADITTDAGVTAVPMSDFYEGDGQIPRHYVRFCCAKKDEVLDAAIERLSQIP